MRIYIQILNNAIDSYILIGKNFWDVQLVRVSGGRGLFENTNQFSSCDAKAAEAFLVLREQHASEAPAERVLLE